jgi:hypothetical protein
LPQCFINHDACGCGKIEATHIIQVHWNSGYSIGKAVKDLRRKPRGFRPEKNVVIRSIAHLIIQIASLAAGEHYAARVHVREKPLQRFPHHEVHFGPVIESGSLEGPVINSESQGFDEMEPGTHRAAQASYIPGVRRDFRMDERHVKHAYSGGFFFAGFSSELP